MTVGVAHVGGHVTLLFSIHDDEILPRRQGSRGAGLCLDAGVRVRAEATPAPAGQISEGATPAPRAPPQPGSIEVSVSDRFGIPWPEGEAMYVMLIDDLRAVRRIPVATSWRLDVRLELPISQGFGMSAAGFLAAARAVLDANGTPDDRYAARVAHRMERLHRGGLGDVLALQAGGMALRRKPGAPNVGGAAEGAILEAPLLLVWQPDESRQPLVERGRPFIGCSVEWPAQQQRQQRQRQPTECGVGGGGEPAAFHGCTGGRCRHWIAPAHARRHAHAHRAV